MVMLFERWFLSSSLQTLPSPLFLSNPKPPGTLERDLKPPFSRSQFSRVPCRLRYKGASQAGRRLPSCGIRAHYPPPAQIQAPCSAVPPPSLGAPAWRAVSASAPAGASHLLRSRLPRTPFPTLAGPTGVPLAPRLPPPLVASTAAAGASEAVPRATAVRGGPLVLGELPGIPRRRGPRPSTRIGPSSGAPCWAPGGDVSERGGQGSLSPCPGGVEARTPGFPDKALCRRVASRGESRGPGEVSELTRVTGEGRRSSGLCLPGVARLAAAAPPGAGGQPSPLTGPLRRAGLRPGGARTGAPHPTEGRLRGAL